MGRHNEYFSSAGRGGSVAGSGQTLTHAHAYQPEEFADPEQLEKLFLGVDILNYLAIKFLAVALLCLLHVEAA
jgi:hypothetical protein